MAQKEKQAKLVVVTGLSGAGKTQAVRALEDLGFFCVDNLPPTLIPKFAELFEETEGTIPRVALVMDIRGGRFFAGLVEALHYLDQHGLAYEILFLEAADETLIRRYKETRRRHPLSAAGHILDGIMEERHRLEELRGRADKIIDTTELTTPQLREQIAELYGQKTGRLLVTVMSFGFKYGIPLDADLVLDVRFLPNPYYLEKLRPFSGDDERVEEYVLQAPAVAEFLERTSSFLNFLLPYYVKEGKSHLVVALGCTGGRHRSVVLANHLARLLGGADCRVTAKHRDVARGEPEKNG